MADARDPLVAINLNLFLVLDALLEHRSATRAARRLGVTPSAVSHSLRELRAVFDDPLFVRARAGLEPTERARALAPAVRAALSALGGVVHHAPAFDPRVSTRHCAIETADDCGLTIMPAFVERVLAEAPRMTLEIRPRTATVMDRLAAGQIDLVLTLSEAVPAWAGRQALYTDGMACVVRPDHPLVGDALTLDVYRRLTHIRIAPEGFGPSIADATLARAGIERHIAVYCHSFMMAPQLVRNADAVLTMPARMARVAAERLGLRVVPTPTALPEFTIDMVWHRGRDDAALAWLRARLLDAAG